MLFLIWENFSGKAHSNFLIKKKKTKQKETHKIDEGATETGSNNPYSLYQFETKGGRSSFIGRYFS